jgi:hypothetical protein
MPSSREEPPQEAWLLGVSRTLLEPNWNWPAHGLRHPAAGGTTTPCSASRTSEHQPQALATSLSN